MDIISMSNSKFNPAEPYQWYHNADRHYAETIERILEDIHFFNFSWEQASILKKELGIDELENMESNYRALKNLRQIELIKFYPDQIQLVRDFELEGEIYSIKLIKAINGHRNAAHIPKRVLNEYSISIIEEEKKEG